MKIDFITASTSWDVPGTIFLKLLAVVFLVLLNGFFVASEFAIVKVRSSQLDALSEQFYGWQQLHDSYINGFQNHLSVQNQS